MDDCVERAARLRIDPWAPRSGRHADRAVTNGIPATDDHWLLDLAPYADEPDDGGRRYRGCRRARHRRAPALIAALVVAASVLLVASGLRGHPGTTPAAQTATAPVTYQADAPANTLYGSAHVTPYPGASDGLIVQTLGNWGKGGGEGALRINDVVVPGTGVYLLTLYYVLPDNEPTRAVTITASGESSVSVTVAGNATCCLTQMARVELSKGTNSITFSNPAGRAPGIDKIVIGPL
jgi:hypothetical protein